MTAIEKLTRKAWVVRRSDGLFLKGRSTSEIEFTPFDRARLYGRKTDAITSMRDWSRGNWKRKPVSSLPLEVVEVEVTINV